MAPARRSVDAINDDLETCLDEIEAIRSRYGTDPANMPSGQAQRLDNMTRHMTRLRDELDVTESYVQRIDAVRAAAQNARGLDMEGGSQPDGLSERYPAVRRGDPWRSGDETAQGWVSRAHSVLEYVPDMPTAARNRYASLIDDIDDSPNAVAAARHAVLTSSEAYRSAFYKVIRDPMNGHRLWTPEELAAVQQSRREYQIHRAAMSLNDSNGGYLVPFTLDPTVNITNAGVIDPIRQISTVKTTATDSWNGVSSAGITAEWTAEAAEWSDASPTFAQPSIVPKKADAWIQGSYEVLGDSGFVNDLGRLLADAKARHEAAAFATGNVGATRPRGVVAAVAAVAGCLVPAAANGALAVGDVYNLFDATTPRADENLSVIANKKIFTKIRQFDTAGGSSFWADMNTGQPPRLIGNPAYQCSSMNGALAAGANALLAGNFHDYVIVDRIGMSVLYQPIVMGPNGRPTGQAGWAAYWRVGADVINADSFRLLQLSTAPTVTPLG